MLQLNLKEYGVKDIPALLDLVEPILQKRDRLHKKYTRGANASTLLFNDNNKNTKLPFEKFIVDLATGYTSGKPTYNINATKDEDSTKLLNELFDIPKRDDDYINGMALAIKYISNYNDDGQENYDLIHDLFELTSCYEVVYENENNEIIYSKYSPLQTVATWDYNIPANLTGLIRVWEERQLNGDKIKKIELTDENSTRVYTLNGTNATEDFSISHEWGDVPAIAVETDFALFETCEDIISAYEQLVQNIRNTYQYNDSDCKLKITNYTPENPQTIINENGEVIPNPARMVEDSAWINSRTIYVGENGDVSWLSKPVDASGFTINIKAYSDLMFQLAGIPNTSDLAFNSSDLNTSAIDRKFYIMNMATASVVSQLKKAYLRRWELIFNRINVKKGTTYDFRDIVVDIPKNLPANDDEMISSLLKLKGTISEKTIVDKLGYDFTVEKQQMEEETTDNILASIENMKLQVGSGLDQQVFDKNSTFNSYDTSKKGVERDEMEGNGQDSQTESTQN